MCLLAALDKTQFMTAIWAINTRLHASTDHQFVLPHPRLSTWSRQGVWILHYPLPRCKSLSFERQCCWSQSVADLAGTLWNGDTIGGGISAMGTLYVRGWNIQIVCWVSFLIPVVGSAGVCGISENSSSLQMTNDRIRGTDEIKVDLKTTLPRGFACGTNECSS